MKKLLVFLLLFGAGLGILLLLQEPTAVVEPAPPPTPRPPAPEPKADGGEPERRQDPLLTVRGKVRYKQHAAEGDVRPLLYELDAADSGRPEGAPQDETHLFDVTIRIYDPEDGSLDAELAAGSAIAHILPAPGGELGFRFDPAFALTDVVMTVHDGAPLVPLRIEVPWLDGDLDALVFRSRVGSGDRAVVIGPGLELSGQDLLVDLAGERFELASAGSGSIALETGLQASLDCTGPLRVDRRGGRVAIEASDEARLRTAPPRASQVSADRITLFAEVEGDLLRPREGEAVGNVRFDSTESGSFSGREAELGFGRNGSLASLELSGDPRAALPLGDLTDVLPGVEAGDLLDLAGDGPLRVDRVAGTFSLDSPGSLSLGGARLDAGRRLVGRLGSAVEPPSFTAEGDVRLVQEDSELTTTELEVSYRRPVEAGAPGGAEGALRAVAVGPSLLRQGAPGQEGHELRTEERLEVLVRGELWSVPLAVGARITIGGEDPIRASAERLRDVDAESGTFRAEGAVALESGDRRVDCELLQSLGSETWIAAGAPARFVRPGLVASAERVEREGSVLRAEGGVDVELDQGGARVTLAAARCELDEVRPGVSGDPATWVSHLRASGDVDASLVSEAGAHRVRCDRLVTEANGTGEGDERRWIAAHWEAEGSVAGSLTTEEGTYDLACRRLEADFRAAEPDAEPGADELVGFLADGNVNLRGGVSPLLRAHGERLWMDESRSGRLEAPEGERVRAEGYLPGGRQPFELEADWIEFTPDSVVAGNPQGRFAQLSEDAPAGAPPLPGAPQAPVGLTTDMRGGAQRIEITRAGVVLTGDVRVYGTDPELPAWALSAQRVEVAGHVSTPGAGPAALHGLTATGGVSMDLGQRGRLVGESLRASAATGSAVVIGSPARLERGGLAWESERLEYDMNHDLPASGAGRLFPLEVEDPDEAWELSYESLETLVEPDRLILAMRNVVYRTSRRLLRSSWAAFWVDRRQWENMGAGDQRSDELRAGSEELEAILRERPSSALLFQTLRESEFGDVLRELYLEGPIELFEDGVQFFNAEAFFLDAVDGHGWIADADLYMERSIEGRKEIVTVHADWLRHSKDGALHASDATMTACTHDDPHMWITTRGLTIIPIYTTGKAAYDVELRKNAVHLYDVITLPMGTVRFQTDKEGHVLIESLRLGSSGQFGNFLEATIERDMGDVGKGINKALGGDPKSYRASYRLEASYLGSRGILLDLGARLRSDGRYWWNFHVGGLDDSDEDRGLVEIPKADRDGLRLWYRSRGRYLTGETSWFDLAFSSQTDPGVQAEFWENDYLHYEQRETDLAWRGAWGANYVSARALARVDDFRTEVERLPEVIFAHTPTPLFTAGALSVLYSTVASASWLNRLEGTFEDPFADGLGEREVMRVDNTQRLESPIDLGALSAAGVRATPFVELRGTAWDEGVDPTTSPTRGVLTGGMRLATTLWKRVGLGDGGLHELSPFVEARRAYVDESDGVPVVFDRTEDVLEGQLFTLGLRSRWLLDSGRFLDVELQRTHASHQAAGAPDRWQPLEVFAGLDSELAGMPLAIIHDGRYDLEAGHTAYSLTSLGFRPTDRLTVEMGHRTGDEPLGNSIFESASIAARYRWTPKWEFEAAQTFSLLGDESLATRGIVRRYGHDLLFEIEVSDREGQGSTIGINVRPLLGYRPGRLGVIDF